MIRILTIILFSFALCCPAVTVGAKEYSANSPLVYEDSWSKWPYSFLNDNEEPDGFNVELIREVMSRLDIPYVIRLRDQQMAHNDLKNNVADISYGIEAYYNASYGKFGNVTICNFVNGMMIPRADSTKARITLEDIMDNPKYRPCVRVESRALHYLKDNGVPDSIIDIVNNMEVEILARCTQHRGGMIWNDMMLKWVKNKYKLHDYCIVPVDIPAGEYRFMSNDVQLLHRVDSVLTILKENGDIDAMVNHWMYPEKKYSQDNLAITLLGVLVLLVLGVAAWNVIMYYRRYYSHSTLDDVNKRMSLILEANHIQVWIYYPLTHRYAWMTREGKVEKVYSSYEFSQFYPEGEFNQIHTQVMEFMSQDHGPVLKKLRSYSFGDSDEILDVEVYMEVMKDEYGKINLICGVQHDITSSTATIDRMRLMNKRQQTSFNISTGGIMQFDKEGILMSMNDAMCEILDISDKEKMLKRHININDIDILRDVDIDDISTQRAFVCMHKPERSSQEEYYYVNVLRNTDTEGLHIGYMIFIREMTDDVVQQKMLIKRRREQRHIERQKELLFQRRNFSVKAARIWMVRYYYREKHMVLYDREHNTMHSYNQLQILKMIDQRDIKKVFRLFNLLDSPTNEQQHIVLHTLLHNQQRQKMVFSVDTRAIENRDGVIDSYLAICRDITEQEQINLQLQEESEKVRETDHVRSTFLSGMSLSIRQPLITIERDIQALSDATGEKEKSLLHNIDDNVRHLIKLSDDTLLLSRIDANMLVLDNKVHDFTSIYRESVERGINRFRSNSVAYNVIESYNELLLSFDATLVGRVIEEAVGLSARYTRYGNIKVRYIHRRNSLTIAIEDDGPGIPQQILREIFQPRFGGLPMSADIIANISGLEMPLCKAIVEALGGNIDIESEVGRGISIYVQIPVQEVETH